MPLLTTLTKVPSPEIMQQIASYYGNLFPIEIRYCLAEFLESKLFCLIAPNESKPQFESDARQFFDEFIKELERKAAELNDNFQLPTKMRLLEAARNMRTQNPVAVYSHLIKCMSYEQQILEYSECNNGNEVTQTLRQEIEILLNNSRLVKDIHREWRRKSDAYYMDYHELNLEEGMDDDSNLDQQNVDAIVRQLRQETLDLDLQAANEECQKLMNILKNNALACVNLTSKVVDDYITYWKWYQKYEGSNSSINGADLNCIQEWCEKLAESLWNTREQIRLTLSYQQQFGDNEHGVLTILPEMFEKVTNTLEKLVNGSFIFEKQPPQVMKTNTKFTTTLRLLIGGALGLKISSPSVSAKIVSDTQAKLILQTNNIPDKTCGEIINGIKNFEFVETTRHMSVKFDNLKLHKFKRQTRRSSENVTDEKFALYFQTALSIGDFNIKISAMSLPIVVIVHGSQESLAWATIFWDNSFSTSPKTPFEVPEKVPFKQFAEAINQKCIDYNERGLTPENIHCLAEKLFNMPFPNGIPEGLDVSWTQFCKENLQDRKFSFWEWYHSALLVTRDHLRRPWIEDSIVGFMSKAKVEEYLKNSVHGTFLLRFSDSELGAISIAWMRRNGTPQVLHIQPFNAKDLSARTIADRLFDLDQLQYLYPNKPKCPTFERFRQVEGRAPPVRLSYVPAVMKLVVFDDNKSQQADPQPSTSQFNPLSPDQSMETSDASSGPIFTNL